ncbi:hypothetical protein BDR07DRAFT_1427601 [Suillus spraguei]|nr:hypothetical protein BDR07DRAFT_1427601 [Suillus spraguei]
MGFMFTSTLEAVKNEAYGFCDRLSLMRFPFADSSATKRFHIILSPFIASASSQQYIDLD